MPEALGAGRSGEGVANANADPASRAETSGPDSGSPASGSLAALCLIARLHHVAADPAHLAHRLGWSPSHVPDTRDLLLAAMKLGLKAKLTKSSLDRLTLVALPALAIVADGKGTDRVVVLAQCDGQRVLFQDPSGAIQGGRPVIEPVAAFAERWTGELILVTSRASLAGELAKFDFSWFIPSLVKYRRLFGEVLVVSLFLQLFALVSPLFFQVVMDKVLVHRGLTTLDVLVIGLAVVVVFESVLTLLRTYVFSHTTSRIDVELGARLFRHLVSLPLAYFQARRVGDSVARVRELENIRSFLTGNALTVVLDVAVLGDLRGGHVRVQRAADPYRARQPAALRGPQPGGGARACAARLNEKFARGAENQALLVETVTGIQTVKANALEPAIAQRLGQPVGRLCLGKLPYPDAGELRPRRHQPRSASWSAPPCSGTGARLVIEQQLTVGQFVAFNMFAQRVAQPIMRMAQLWTDFQQTGISMARLGDILNTRTEVPPTTAAQLPALKGRVHVRCGHLPLPTGGGAGAAGTRRRRARRRGDRHRRPQRAPARAR